LIFISARVSYNKLGQDDSLLENENDRMVTNLASKISSIKSVSFFRFFLNNKKLIVSKHLFAC